MRHVLILFCFLFAVKGTFAQVKGLRSGEILEKAQALSEKEDHKKAIELLKSVHEADTGYFKVQAYLAEVAFNAKEYDEAIKASRTVLNENPHYAGVVYTTLANSLNGKGDTAKALETMAEGIKRYPYFFPLYYLTGLTHYQQKNFDAAETYLQKTLQLNPFHAYSHVMLGLLSARQGNYTHAMMSLSAALLLKNDANNVLVYLENVANDALEPNEKITKKSGVSKNDMADIDQLLKSKIALDSKFKTPLKINAALVKQEKLLLDQFKYNPASEDFWMKFYGPFFQKVKEQNLYKPFVLSQLSSSKIKEALAWNAKSSKEKTAFLQVGSEAFLANRKTQQRTLNGKAETTGALYYENNYVAGVGNFLDNDKTKRTGYWVFYGDNDNIEAEGSYDANHKRTGEWKFYDIFGLLESKEIYENGELNGISYRYDKQGNVRVMAHFKNDKRHGPYENYFACGNISRTGTFNEGKVHGGEKVYNTAGIVIQTGAYINGKADGSWKHYFEDGTLKTEFAYKDDLEEGPVKQYNVSGKLILDGTYKNGNRTGLWKYYHDNGKLNYQLSFNEAGKPEGTSKEYNQLGKLSTENKYAEGELAEEINYDETDEKLWSIYKYNKGKVVSYTYFDKNGKEIFTFKAKKATVPVKGFTPEGKVMFTGAYTDGDMDGDWTFYNRNGVKTSEMTYKNGLTNGPAKTFYVSGGVYREYYNVDGQKNGSYKEYYANGKLRHEGWMIDGNQEFTWKEFHPNGQLDQELFYLNDQSTGIEKSFTATGEKKSQINYNYDDVLEYLHYNKDGSEAQRVKPNGKTYSLTYNFMNGKPNYIFPMACNKYNGTLTWYYQNGKKSSEIAMIDGKRSGKCKTYYENGNLESEGMYRNGKQIGHWKYFDEQGKLESEGKFNNGRDSVWVTYWPNGKVFKTQEFLEGDLNGKYQSFDSEGNLMMERFYLNDDIVSYRYLLPSGKFSDLIYTTNGNLKLVAYYQNGKKSVEYNYENGNLHGPQKMYYANGNLMEADEFNYGYSSGKELAYYANGKLRSEKTYVNQALEGEIKFYNEDGSLHRVETYVANEQSGPTMYYKGGKIEKKVTFWNGIQYE